MTAQDIDSSNDKPGSARSRLVVYSSNDEEGKQNEEDHPKQAQLVRGVEAAISGIDARIENPGSKSEESIADKINRKHNAGQDRF